MKPSEPSQATPLAIIGIGCLFPRAEGPEAYWANILGQVDAITEVPETHWRPSDYVSADPKTPDRTYTARGAFLSPIDFNPLEFGISPKDIEATDTTQLLGLVVAKQALQDAGYWPESTFNRERVSVILGVTGTLELVIPLGARLGHPIWRRALREAGVEHSVAEDVVKRISDSYVGWQENSFPGLLGNVVAGRIANRLNLGGTNCVVDAACASSLSALHLAALELSSGKSDIAITGGLDAFNDIFMFMCFSKTPALSPSGEAKPFDAHADGTILGEGLGVLVIKRLADAERDGDRIYAVIRGMGSSSDGRGNAIYAPCVAGQALALRDAYRRAGVTPDTIELVEAHGTGTKVGDAIEVAALTEVYRAAKKEGVWCALGSVKSQIGHTKAAAGAAGLIKTALALYWKVLPPTIKVRQPMDALASGATPLYVNTEKRPWLPQAEHPRRAAVSSFGFGGSNFHCVLEEHAGAMPGVAWDGDVQILTFSGGDVAGLRQKVGAWPAELAWPELRRRAALARTRFDPREACRLLVVVERGRTDMAKLLAAAAERMSSCGGESSWNLADGAFFGAGKAEGQLALLFPGQGSQYVGMLRDLACHFPSMQETLAQANDVFAEGKTQAHGERLVDFIYPHSIFGEEDLARREDALRATPIAQPAIGAVSLGGLRVLESFGLRPDAAAGHSFGELTALCASGRLSAESFFFLSRLRGRLMGESAGDRGGMLAVQATPTAVETVLREEGLHLTLANKNAPGQTVLSGPTPEINRAAEAFSKREIAQRRLPVSAAFHSPLVSAAREPFRAALSGVTLSRGRYPVFANSTAREYPDSPEESMDILSSQMTCPVEFVSEIQNLYQAGVRTFLEVGPGARLSGLVRAILRESAHAVSALDASSGKRSGFLDLARVLAQLSALGHEVQLSLWDGDRRWADDPAAGKKPSMTVSLCGANYVHPRPPQPPLLPKMTSPQAAGPAPLGPGPSESARPPRRDIPAPAGPISPEPAPEVPVCPSARAPVSCMDALRITQEGLAALQKFQEQTAHLHRRFLEGQEAAQRSFQALLEQQQRWLEASLGVTSASGPMSPEARATRPPSEKVDPAAELASRPEPQPEASPPSARASADGPPPSSARTPVAPLSRGRATDPPSFPAAPSRELAGAFGPPGPPHPPTVTPAVDSGASPLAGPNGHEGTSRDEYQRGLLAIVSEKTGYPVEMLDLDMQLDSDLGIDSIKRVEILSAIQERFAGLPEFKSESLGDFRTLMNVLDFLDRSAPPLLRESQQRPGTPSQKELPPGPVPPSPPESQLRHDVRAAAGVEKVHATLLRVIAEKTGYPVEMLELDMQMDADLGIDSIKRVEILSALGEELPGLPEIKSDHLGALHTLRQVLDFLTQGSAGDAVANREGESVSSASVPEREAGAVERPRRGVETQPDTRQALQCSALCCIPIGERSPREKFNLAPGAEIWILDGGSELAAGLKQSLASLNYAPRLCSLDGLAGLSRPATLGGLIILSPDNGGSDAFVKRAFRWIQFAGPGLRAAGKCGAAMLVTVSRLDGEFGLNGLHPQHDPAAGGLAGLVKTAQHEWSEVHCKALDVASRLTDVAKAAAAILEEMFQGLPVEVGVTDRGRHALELRPSPLGPGIGPPPLKPSDVVVISGGARGITARVALALARAFRPTLVLLGRSPEPRPEPDWLAGLEDEAAIKKAIQEHIGGSPPPKLIGEEYRARMASREMARNFEYIRAAGSPWIYRSVDVRNPTAVRSTIQEIRKTAGPIRGLIHGAGVLADRLIEDKTEEQFELVYDTKVRGLRNLIGALSEDDLRILVLFSSTTARFGRTGQADYAAANEVLNKIAQQQARLRSGCRVLALNWGPWEGGMVTPSLRKVFEKEGVGMIPLDAGSEFLIQEIQRPPGPRVEMVVLGSVPAPDGSPGATTGRDEKPPTTDSWISSFERMLDLDQHPFLKSHVMNGRAVLPLAMVLEWLAHGALHGNPGLIFHGLDNLRILRGVTLEDREPYTIQILAGKARRQDGSFIVPTELRGWTVGSRPSTHARSDIVLVSRLPEDKPILNLGALQQYPRSVETIYNDGLLFHGPDLQGIERVLGCSGEGIVAEVMTSPKPSQWLKQPLRDEWVADPLVLDSSFQMMILWSIERHGAGSLPCFVRRYRQFQRFFPEDGVRVVVQVKEDTRHRGLADIEFFDRGGRLVARMESTECVIDASLNEAFRANQLAE